MNYDDILDSNIRQMNWIPCKDRLPDDFGTIYDRRRSKRKTEQIIETPKKEGGTDVYSKYLLISKTRFVTKYSVAIK